MDTQHNRLAVIAAFIRGAHDDLAQSTVPAVADGKATRIRANALTILADAAELLDDLANGREPDATKLIARPDPAAPPSAGVAS